MACWFLGGCFAGNKTLSPDRQQDMAQNQAGGTTDQQTEPGENQSGETQQGATMGAGVSVQSSSQVGGNMNESPSWVLLAAGLLVLAAAVPTTIVTYLLLHRFATARTICDAMKGKPRSE